jgi:hypothetical protein
VGSERGDVNRLLKEVGNIKDRKPEWHWGRER